MVKDAFNHQYLSLTAGKRFFFRLQYIHSMNVKINLKQKLSSKAGYVPSVFSSWYAVCRILDFHCSYPFGMESGRITDNQITASSSFVDGLWSPRQARLNYDNNAWTPSEDSNKEYIQVSFHQPQRFIRAVFRTQPFSISVILALIHRRKMP